MANWNVDVYDIETKRKTPMNIKSSMNLKKFRRDYIYDKSIGAWFSQAQYTRKYGQKPTIKWKLAKTETGEVSGKGFKRKKEATALKRRLAGTGGSPSNDSFVGIYNKAMKDLKDAAKW